MTGSCKRCNERPFHKRQRISQKLVDFHLLKYLVLKRSARDGICSRVQLWLISDFHRASLLSVTFINQLMHSIITVVDVKNLLYKSLKLLQHVSDHIGSIIREWKPVLDWNYIWWFKCAYFVRGWCLAAYSGSVVCVCCIGQRTTVSSSPSDTMHTHAHAHTHTPQVQNMPPNTDHTRYQRPIC